ncbi:hypothetical protein [uncultured Aquimarina sp.]|uniref:hypothetical protein n=1 Tax=uncultured Aquimarina sp. TaxID=575652 RepID=UPI0026273B67|nr:hypothetical protein [uncultured Aquimarina sp.]
MKKPILIILLLLIFVISGISFLLVKSSRDVISSFGEMDNKLSKSSVFVDRENDSLLNAIKDENLLIKARKVDSLITSFKEYLASVKQEMLGVKDPKNYELMDQPNNMFFAESGLSEKGKEFIAKTDQLRENLIVLVESPKLKTKITNTLSTEEVRDRDGRRRKWLEFNFKDFPVIANITRLTQMQSDVIAIESDIYRNYIIE